MTPVAALMWRVPVDWAAIQEQLGLPISEERTAAMEAALARMKPWQRRGPIWYS